MNKTPATVKLVNAEGSWTPHEFVRLEAVKVEVVHELADGTVRKTMSTGVAQIFRCTETYTERRWGIQ